MKIKFVCFLVFILSFNIAFAQKQKELDLQKSLKGQAECLRIRDWKLMKTITPMKIDCELDNMHFYSDVPLSVDNQKDLRIGNYNILHPGTDKTLFKDMTLTAELINQEFDVMAGVELIDVVATPRDNNLKILPLIVSIDESLKLVSDQISTNLLKIKSLRSGKVAIDNNATIVALNKKMEEETISLNKMQNNIDKKNEDLKLVKDSIIANSKPGPVIKGIEKAKKVRLARLKKAKVDEKKILKDISILELKKETSLKNIAKIKLDLQNLPQGSKQSETDSQGLIALELEQKSLLEKEKLLEEKLKQVTRFYRIPGYLKILEQLRKLDSSWSLIVSPHGDAAVESNTQEMVGYFYRASRLRTANNVHCSNRFNKPSAGCYPNFYEDYMGENMATLFSRRPFLATFTDGQMPFSLLAAHVVFESPSKPEIQKMMLEKAFKVRSLEELPTGINNANYARFIEVMVSLQLIEKLRKEGMERVIYTGDLNLELKNPFWKEIFRRVGEQVILVEKKTSLSENRFVQNAESLGLGSNYDHFIMSIPDASHCKNADHVNFMTNSFSKKIKDKYFIRTEGEKGPYDRSKNAEEIINARSKEMELILQDYNFLVSKTNDFTVDNIMIADDMKNFVSRVFDAQVEDETYYKVFVQVMSDHLPIKMECRF